MDVKAGETQNLRFSRRNQLVSSQCGKTHFSAGNLFFAKGGLILKRWIVFSVVIFAVAFFGNWLWKEFSPSQSGALADVTWEESGKPYAVKVKLVDQEGNPLVASLITVYTDDGYFDFTTNIKGEGSAMCSGTVVFGIQAQHRTVFSKSLARYTGSPPLANGLDFTIVAKRPDVLAPAGGYDHLKYEKQTGEALKSLDEHLVPREVPELTAPVISEPASPEETAEPNSSEESDTPPEDADPPATES